MGKGLQLDCAKQGLQNNGYIVLNSFCILSDDWETLLQTQEYTKDIFPVFLINHTTSSVALLFELIYKKYNNFPPEGKFSICFNFNEVKAEGKNGMDKFSIDDFLYNIVFHPAFFVKHNVPHIFYTGPENPEPLLEKNLNVVSHLLLSQSYSEVQFEKLNTAKYTGIDSHVSLLSSTNDLNTFSDLYLSCLRKGHYSKYFTANINTTSVAQLQYQILATEQRFLELCPLQYGQMRKLAEIQEKNAVLEWKQKIYEIQLDNFKTYLKLIVSQDEARTINQFYYYEYEILPLWFKRLGHIIKVATGRRTLKSLYSKRANKYKK